MKRRGRRVKRIQVQAGDGWTVVTHGSGRPRGKGEEEKVLEEARPTRVVEGLTVAKLVGDFGEMEKRWKNTRCADGVEELSRRSKWHVKEAICIGIGSFSVDWEHRHRSMWQLVLFTAVAKLVTGNCANLHLYAQEPAFNSLDESFLAALNIAVLPAGAQTRISTSSFVFAPFVDWFILLPIFLKNKDPRLYFGNEILDDYSQYAQSEEKGKALEECNAIGKKFLEGRQGVGVPEFELHADALNGLVVYWRGDDAVK